MSKQPPDSESAYFLHEDKERQSPVVGAWRVGFCDGFCDSCCSCFVPTFVPCVGIAEAASAITTASSAAMLGLVFGVLYLGASVFDLLLLANSLQPNEPSRSVASGDATAAIVVGSALCSVLYSTGLWVFRSCFRGELRLPGNCCWDCLAACLCSCCVVAQMRTHVKRSERRRDLLPAYQAA